MIRVLVVDDHALVREGLLKVISGQPDIVVVAEADDVPEALAKIKTLDLDVVILDFNLPGRSGLDAIPHIHALKPRLPILMLSMMPEEEVAVRAFKAGAAGFVSKNSVAEDIVTAVRRVASGQKYVHPNVADILVSGMGTPVDRLPHERLSDREFQVLRLIARGRSTRQIGDELSLSINTIATYRRRIYEKLDVDSDVALARYAIQHGLAD